ncbi:hypothetical protein EVG20_g8175 [Dentipellis fragilis]|uniref:Uncharacterized protein n=1 Tax=Dentipellis fragilis TaxID=205917 RepID=A0A4Y9Y876_9AGAM|nr:hypothetical protein EVG20_g8175 [Dentipellis fragilis]
MSSTLELPQSYEWQKQMVAKYMIAIEKVAQKVRNRPDLHQLHREMGIKWYKDPENPRTRPPPNDERGRAEHFMKCNAICDSEPLTLEDCFRIKFAAYVGLTAIMTQDYPRLPTHQQNSLLAEANNMMMEEIRKDSADHDHEPAASSSSGRTSFFGAPAPAYESSGPTINPTLASTDNVGPELVGQTLTYTDTTGEDSKVCEVLECRVNVAEGKTFVIKRSDATEQISEQQMKEILRRRL